MWWSRLFEPTKIYAVFGKYGAPGTTILSERLLGCFSKKPAAAKFKLKASETFEVDGVKYLRFELRELEVKDE